MSNIVINPYTFDTTVPFVESFWGAGGTNAAWASGNFHSDFTSGVWTNQTVLGTSVQITVGAGGKSDSKIMGGDTSPAGGCGDTQNPTAIVADWNGAAWSAGTSLNAPRNSHQGGGGTTDATWVAVGKTATCSNTPVNTTEFWNSVTWSAGTIYPLSVRGAGGSGNVDTCWLTCGYTGAVNVNSTYHYDSVTWSAGGSYPYSNSSMTPSGAGQNNNAIMVNGGGYNPETYTYDGITWTRGGDTSYSSSNNTNMGVPTNAMNTMGYVGSNIWDPTWAELYDGAAWSATGSLPTGRSIGGSGN